MTMRRTPEGGAAGRTGADAEAWNMSLTPPFAFDLVMFDLDGTLIETVADLSDALNDTLADLGHRPPAQALVAGWIGNGTRELLVRGLAEVTGQAPEDLRDSEPVRRAVAIFDPHYERRCGIRSRLAPHAADVLRRLRAHGVPGRRQKSVTLLRYSIRAALRYSCLASFACGSTMGERRMNLHLPTILQRPWLLWRRRTHRRLARSWWWEIWLS